MFIDPFWMGVITTIAAEIVAIFIYGVVQLKSDKNNKK